LREIARAVVAFPHLYQEECNVIFTSAPCLVTLLTLAGCSAANAHCEVGDRTFASAITFDDPCVTDELSLPTIQRFKNGDEPAAQELDVSGEYTKTITRNFGISVEEEWVHLDIPGEGNRSGFDNLGTSFKYQFVRDAHRELAMSVALDVDWGGTGAKAIDAEPFTTLTPTWFAGKGFGSTSSGFLRPLAVTTELGYAFPTQSSTTEVEDGLAVKAHNPQVLVWGGSVQYSMPYLKEKVADLGLPAFVNHLILITEFNFQTATSNFDEGERTTGTISPGVIYMAESYQFGVEAIIPLNRASGDDIGVIGNVSFFLEDILPHSLGKPLFGSASGEHLHE
jgi:hypothetical protein